MNSGQDSSPPWKRIRTSDGVTSSLSISRPSVLPGEVGIAPFLDPIAVNADISKGAELNYDDVKLVVFTAAAELQLPTLKKCMEIIKAAANGVEIMKKLVGDHDNTGLSLLKIGVKNNQLPFCAFLLDEGADVNYNPDKRSYALQIAALMGLEDMTKLLLDHGANREAKNLALVAAAHFGDLSVLMVLLASGADLNYASKRGTTPLMRATLEGRDDVVEHLINQGVNTCAANNEGMTALMLAAQLGFAPIVKLLAQTGPNLNQQTSLGATALLLAAKRGHMAVVDMLMAAGADISIKDARNNTAAQAALHNGFGDLSRLITVHHQLLLMGEPLQFL